MAKIKVGDICYFDPLNVHKQSFDGTNVVKVVSIKRHIFRKTSYITLSLQTGNVIECNNDILVKVGENDIEEKQIVIRLDNDNIPTITDTDIKALSDIIDLMTNSAPELKQKLSMLKTKLEYFNEIGDV